MDHERNEAVAPVYRCAGRPRTVATTELPAFTQVTREVRRNLNADVNQFPRDVVELMAYFKAHGYPTNASRSS